MKISNGVDLIEVERVRAVIERQGERFLQRVFTHQELTEANGSAASLAARFAAKEAAAKALGTGIGPVAWRDIEILHGPQRAPQLLLHGAAQCRSAELGLTVWTVSLSHTHDYAVAMVVALGD